MLFNIYPKILSFFPQHKITSPKKWPYNFFFLFSSSFHKNNRWPKKKTVDLLAEGTCQHSHQEVSCPTHPAAQGTSLELGTAKFGARGSQVWS